jgi:hypothetical protein
MLQWPQWLQVPQQGPSSPSKSQQVALPARHSRYAKEIKLSTEPGQPQGFTVCDRRQDKSFQHQHDNKSVSCLP